LFENSAVGIENRVLWGLFENSAVGIENRVLWGLFENSAVGGYFFELKHRT